MNASQSSQLRAMSVIAVMALVAGLLASAAWVTNRSRESRLLQLGGDAAARISLEDLDTAAEIKKQREEIQSLREETTRLQNLLANNTNASEELNSSLQELKAFAALTEVQGPGVTITLSDSRRPLDEVMDPNENIIHDQDVVSVLNELRNAGAEAISVNDKRLGPTSWVRCAGTRILVDNVQVAAPVVIRAIGNARDLYNSMNMPGGYLDQLRQADPAMVKIEIAEKLNLPAYAGSTRLESLEPVKKNEEESDQN